ncbi:MAG TPA: hypothetical protein VGQ46_13715 [Thermoanaerobaculia bacterium]|jgi:hypothetical protein|nr:hypothetical protein [Thermoanaerobaculia bacterium]
MRSIVTKLVVVLSLVSVGVTAQTVKVFDTDLPFNGSNADTEWVQPTGLNQKILLIPVVTHDTPWDPLNNPLDPAMKTSLQNAIAQVSSFWFENSYGAVSFSGEVMDHVYQLPRGKDFYFNPAYIEPLLLGTQIKGATVTVPAGMLSLQLHVSDADQTTINILFNMADSPFTPDALQHKICDNLGVGDKLTCSIENDGAGLHHLRIAVPQTYVSAGTFIHVDAAASAAGVVDALGLSRPVENVTVPGLSLDTVGTEFPFTISAPTPITLTLTNSAGMTEDFVWNLPAQTFHTAGEIVTAIGTGNPNGTITAAGGGLHFAVTPVALAGPFKTLEASGNADALDSLGLAKAREDDGVIDEPSRLTVKGNRNLIAGQAIAAMLINELSRPAGAGPDLYPNQDIIAANQAAIDTLLHDNIDVQRSILVVFLDQPPNQREAAAGGYVNIGIENGGYTYQYQTRAFVQILYASTADSTIAHEVGHNLGFWDLYNNSTDYLPSYRFPNNWDVMNWQSLFPHTGLWHKHFVDNWLTPAGAVVDSFPEPPVSTTEIRHYAITPLEMAPADYDNLLAGIPAGVVKVKGVQLQLGMGPIGEHHYLTIDNRQAGVAFSHQLPQKVGAAGRGGLYIADSISPEAMSQNLLFATTRNAVHPLTDVPLVGDDVSPILDNGVNPDINLLSTFPAYAGINVDIVGSLNGPGAFADRKTLLVDVRRQQLDFLDLAITPWGAPPYESPDIWIEHPDHPLSPIPLPGNGEPARWSTTYDPAVNGPLNLVRVKVSNIGTVGATNVRVRVKVNQPGGMGDAGTWVALPTSDPQDVAAGSSGIFNVGWTPRVNEHTCIQAEVISWDSALGDRDPFNQATQENINDFNPTSSSPWAPTPMAFDVSNRRSTPIQVYVAPQNLPPGYIVQLEKDYFTVPAKSKVRINGTLSLDSAVIPPLSPQNPRPPKPGLFHMAAFLINGDYRLPMGGITYRVFPNRKIHADMTVETDPAGNIVVKGTTSPAAPGDHIEILVCYASGKCEWVQTTTDGAGNIDAVIPPKEAGPVKVTVYLPPNYGPSRTVDANVDPAHPGGPPASACGGVHEFGFFLGGFFPPHATRLDSGLDTGFRFGRTIAPHWSVEGEGGVVFTRRLGQHGLLGHAQAHAVWHAGSTAQPVRLFLLAGAGLASFQSPAFSDTTPAAVVGAGADFRWRCNLGFRIDVRDFIMSDLFHSGTAHDFQALWGVTFRF